MRARGLPFVFAASVVVWAGCSSPKNDEVVRTDKSAAASGPGYCRSTTCPVPVQFPQGGLCEPDDWPKTCAAAGVKDYPLWWKSGCVGWSLQKDGGQHVSFDDAYQAAAGGFQAWASRSCPTNGKGSSRPTIDARYLGPVACAESGYNRVAANQNEIVFRDSGWPHNKPSDPLMADGRSPTIALTTVTFNPDTGEILDADIELNTHDHKVIPLETTTALDGDTFDLQSVLTHEIGHVFGIAHAPSKSSVMFYQDEGTDIRKRTIGLEDVAAICAVYPPDGTRTVALEVDPTGKVPMTACDPTPRHGFTSECQHDPTSGCSVGARARTGEGARAGWLAMLGVAATALVRRRRPRISAARAASAPAAPRR